MTFWDCFFWCIVGVLALKFSELLCFTFCAIVAMFTNNKNGSLDKILGLKKKQGKESNKED